MDAPPTPSTREGPKTAEPEIVTTVRSLQELIEHATGNKPGAAAAEGDAGLAEAVPYPFLAIVGQREMKLALMLALINPAMGGVLLIGTRGTGKTTAVRSLVDLLPHTQRSLCRYGCLPEDLETGGMEAVCPDCARKYAEGEPLAALDRVRLVELPLNAGLEDVVGGIDERTAPHSRLLLRRGLLSQADRNLLFVDEVNLLSAGIVDAILDAAAQGSYAVRRGPVSGVYRSRFVLLGSMNPEEGRIRPQILDRFGLRVVVRALADPGERLEAYRRSQAYLASPRGLAAAYSEETSQAREEIQAARDLLPRVTISDPVAKLGIKIIQKLGIDSLRAELTLLESARALAAAGGRTSVEPGDLLDTALLALRLRRSDFMTEYLARQAAEETEIGEISSEILA